MHKVNKAIQVALVEDDPDLRANLAAMLNSSAGFHCQAAYPNGAAALRGISSARPDVVLMDINLPGMSGPECVRELKNIAPGMPVLMLTVYEDSEQIFKSLMSGAMGYLLKRTPRDKLLEAIREVNAGGAPMSRQIARRVVEYFQKVNEQYKETEHPSVVVSLTDREREVLAALAKGYAYKEIAGQLKISFETVRTHLRAIYEKLHVHSRTEAVLKYFGR
ncbi:MAG TPA: response regulator transcription factor [Verrucomicrobiae bacterium]